MPASAVPRTSVRSYPAMSVKASAPRTPTTVSTRRTPSRLRMSRLRSPSGRVVYSRRPTAATPPSVRPATRAMIERTSV
jgi:hypothetical protein